MSGKKLTGGKSVIFLIIFLNSTFALFPVIYLIVTSLKTVSQIFSFPPPLIFCPTIKNWNSVISGTDFLRYYLNSIIISSCTVALVIVTASFSGYSLARFSLPYKENIAFWILSVGMMPPVAVLLPLYVLFTSVHLLDTYIGLVIIYTAFNLPFAVWLMRGFFEGVPVELEEAALVDGAGLTKILFKITLPLVKPGLIACAVYTFIMSINEFFLALVLSGSRARPASVAILQFLPTGVRGTLYGEAAVAALLIMAPSTFLFATLQRYLISGLTFGALKE